MNNPTPQINLLQLPHQESSYSFVGTWDEIKELEQENQNRVSFLYNVITIMSPSFNHEAIASVLGDLIKAFCDHQNLIYFAMGSTTITKAPYVGKQPDASFSFNQRKDVPDIAIEVVFSSGGLDDLEKYRNLEVKEVWMWKNQELTFYVLNNKYQYEEKTCSHFLRSLFSTKPTKKLKLN